jgi:hypothetical protein
MPHPFRQMLRADCRALSTPTPSFRGAAFKGMCALTSRRQYQCGQASHRDTKIHWLRRYLDHGLPVERLATDDKQPKRSAMTTECGRSLVRRSPSSACAPVDCAMIAYRALRKIGFGYHNRVNRELQQISWVFLRRQNGILSARVRNEIIGQFIRLSVVEPGDFLAIARGRLISALRYHRAADVHHSLLKISNRNGNFSCSLRRASVHSKRKLTTSL